MVQMTVMTGPERRRRWGDDERHRILEAAFGAGAVVAKVARQFDVATSLIYKWRRQEQGGGLEPMFAPAVVLDNAGVPHRSAPEVIATTTPIQVELSGGTRVNIEASAPAALVVAVLAGARDDPDRRRGAGVARGRPHRHAARHERPGAAGAGGAGAIRIAGDLFVFRGARGDLIKILWHDGLGHVALRQAAGARPLHLAGDGATARWRSRPRSSPTCSTGSTGVTRSTPGGRQSARDRVSLHSRMACIDWSRTKRSQARFVISRSWSMPVDALPDDIEALKRAAGCARRAARPSAEAGSATPAPSRSDDRGADRPSEAGDRQAQARQSTARARSARRACSTRWSCSSKSWRPRPPRTRSPPSGRPPRRPTSRPSRASARRASRSPSICRASAWSFRARPPAPAAAARACRKLGEDVTETLEVIPRQWKVIQHVREKFTCRDCESISQPPAPFHVTPRGWAGPNLLAMILFEKFGQHQPLNRQAERYAREGVPLEPVDAGRSGRRRLRGAAAAATSCIEAHVLAAERLHGDDTTVPVLAKGKTDTGRCWVYVRDDRPFGGPAPPAAVFYYSRDRGGEHPRRIWPAGAASCRPTPMAATASSTHADRKPGADPGGGLLGAMRAASSSSSPTSRPARAQGRRQDAHADLAAGAGGRAAHRRPVRHRARHQRPDRRASAWPSARS